eukprot:CAMPEP_0194530894 /NCGR_PEP_ID=MMETSP0253-20130528/68014_1 /TAXON_ID=2966 /ORGANISM="Noctiluca scintillans" /LENGTH=513 /DNA_ID=CAMNT_0039376191 /DNA_START=103 /DNA_END=1642 /DNA_ORIENTATION=-
MRADQLHEDSGLAAPRARFGRLRIAAVRRPLIAEIACSASCDTLVCIKQWISGVCVLPTTVYFIQTIGRYDEELRDKKQRHRREVETLIANINEQVAEMNDLCRKVTENANQFAVGRFNDKADQFVRFLKNVRLHHQDMYVDQEILNALRRFVTTWFQIFAGSMLNPVDNPLLRGAEAEVRKCQTVEQLCNAAIHRLANCKAAFNFQVPAESPYISGTRRLEDGLSAPPASHTAVPVRPTGCCGEAGYCGVSWVRFCPGRCGRVQNPNSMNGMPSTWHFCFVTVRFLSVTHVNLILGFFVDIALLLFELTTQRWASLLLVAINEICVLSLLGSFEAINEVAQLERQIHMFQSRNEEVGRRRDDMKNNWEKVMQLQDLWLYRTLPCLSILGRIHNHLADETLIIEEGLADGLSVGDGRLEFLNLANESLDVLDRKLGTMESWRSGGPLDEEWKASIGKQLQAADTEQDLMTLIASLPILTCDLRTLEASPPSMSGGASSAPRARTASFASSSGR